MTLHVQYCHRFSIKEHLLNAILENQSCYLFRYKIQNLHKQILHVVRRCCHILLSSLNEDLWRFFQLVCMWSFVSWSWLLRFDLVKNQVLNMSWGSRCSDFKRRLAVVINCLFRSSKLAVKVSFFVKSIQWIKCQILFGLLSLSVEVKNSYCILQFI